MKEDVMAYMEELKLGKGLEINVVVHASVKPGNCLVSGLCYYKSLDGDFNVRI